MKSTLRIHTHCQVAQKADAQTKTCQRVWLPQHTDRLLRIKHENTTRYIKHLAQSANFKGSTFNKHCNGLIGNRFKMPNVSYTHPLATININIMNLINHLLLFIIACLFSIDVHAQVFGYNRFQKALYNRDLKTVEVIVENKDPDTIADITKTDILFWYIYFKDKPDEVMYEISDLLFEKGADINRENKYGENIGDILLKRYFDEELGYYRMKMMWFRNYSNSDLLDLYEYLIRKGLNVEKRDTKEETPLYVAVESGDTELLTVLANGNANIDAICGLAQNTPLITAIKGKNTEIIKVLLDNNADVNLADHNGMSPLMVAATFENSDILDLLIEKGASVQQKDKFNQTAYTYAWDNVREKNMKLLELNGSSPDSIPYLLAKEIEKATNGDLSKIKSIEALPKEIFLEKGFLNLFELYEVYKSGFGYQKSGPEIYDKAKVRVYSVQSPDSSYSLIYNSISSSPWEILNIAKNSLYGNRNTMGYKTHVELCFMEDGKKYVIDDSKKKYYKGSFIIYDSTARDFEYYKDNLYINELQTKQVNILNKWSGNGVCSFDSTIAYTIIQNPKNGKVHNIINYKKEGNTPPAFEYELSGEGYIIVDANNTKTVYKLERSSVLIMR
jgi:ankyrin repeat protein